MLNYSVAELRMKRPVLSEPTRFISAPADSQMSMMPVSRMIRRAFSVLRAAMAAICWDVIGEILEVDSCGGSMGCREKSC